jgi:hypothetical protein
VSNDRAIESIQRMFAEKCDGDRDALLAATAIAIARDDQVGPASSGARRLAEEATVARQRPPEVWVAECRALSLARHMKFWVFLNQMFASNPAIEKEMDGYLLRFVPGLLDRLGSEQEGNAAASDSADDVVGWGRALGVFADVWIEGERRGQSEAERMQALWMLP